MVRGKAPNNNRDGIRTMTKAQNIMTTAWNIARNAANEFGGSSREYFAKALELAHKIAKRTKGAVAGLWAFFAQLPSNTRRKDAIAQAEAAGFNFFTARTQYQKFYAAFIK
ncbi:hypothetical protein pD_gene0036 [Vibrio phage 033B]|nr:hypothetical protein pD_gene0036 [Vibrio phage 033B]